VLAGKLWENTPVERVYIPPAPGDAGQALGNALWARHLVLGQRERLKLNSASLGGLYDVRPEQLGDIVRGLGIPAVVWIGDDLNKSVAEMLVEGRIIGLFVGRSEYGPRALGYRSILADPRDRGVIARLNRTIKQREPFMPYAPSVLADQAFRWFHMPTQPQFMEFAFQARANARELMPAVVHVDGTSRLHCVTPDNAPALYRLLSVFSRLAGVPALLNTSLNLRGEPIAETPEDALLLLKSTALDGILFEDKALVLRQDLRTTAGLREVASTLVLPSSSIIRAEGSSVLIEDLHVMARSAFPFHDIASRTRLGLRGEYFEWFRTGKKRTTIRYKPGAVDVPATWQVTLEATGREEVPRLLVGIDLFVIKRYAALSQEDAVEDGFEELSHLQKALNSIYGPIPQTGLVSIYRISLR
jgi:hypothetical protein